MTIGTAIDSYKGFEKVVWSDVSTKEQKLVDAVVSVKKDVLKAEFDEKNAKYQEVLQRSKDKVQKNIKDNIQYVINEYNAQKSDTSPQISEKEIIELANKYCTYNDGFIAISNCDKEAVFGLKDTHALKYTHFWQAVNLANRLSGVKRALEQQPKVLFQDEPKEVKSREYKFNFVINTDKTVNIKGVFLSQDRAKVKRSGLDILSKIYKR
ncbi:hypothetical protein [Campylobacter geochelonis]|uniref:Uncharacterized protein n=1 Tax=Campylobacter geochelonis TaxID=1780362 RepID=A0A128EL86_9BACT|nr:hypothetical protein [Campylobacter geochelonis]QKF71286.1 hypothetical protein CGEO_0971 [Campylobacter geochelonis]CZE49003.1 Uncharacterised protein [Campylobacter geochelonis]